MTYFDSMASNWDTPRRIERAQQIAACIAAHIDPAKDKKALEFGCGSALLSFELLSEIPAISCTDSSPAMLDVARKKIENSGCDGLTILPYDGIEEDCYFGRFDVIFSSMVFHHVTKIDAELWKLRHLLKKGGRLITVDLDKVDAAFHAGDDDFAGHDGFTRDEFAAFLKKAAFTNISFDDCYRGVKTVNDQAVPYSLFICCADK